MDIYKKLLIDYDAFYELKRSNDELRKKLKERQEVINRTNKYWKGVIKNLKKRATSNIA